MAEATVDPVVPAAPAADLSPAIPSSTETVTSTQPVAAAPDGATTATPAPGVQNPPSDAPGAVPVAETPKTEEGFKPTILDEVDKPREEAKPEVKAEEAKPGDEAKPAETVPVELPKIDYWAGDDAIKLPDTLKMDDAQRGELATALDTFRAEPKKGAQAIIDQGVKAMTAALEEQRSGQWKVWNNTQTDWQTQTMADPVLGGAGHDTAMTFVGQGRNKLVSPHKPGTDEFNKDIASFNEMARITGVGNHPVFLKMLHRAGKLFAEAAPPPPDPRPSPDNGRRPNGKRDLYTNTKFPGQA